ncbi:MAG: peptidoglycan DD-metalloendopeptidase family protein [Clostridia bacterium]|nr:peptidoglycan DD-metalloendopeptidase family protein [Clostridia bacterium]
MKKQAREKLKRIMAMVCALLVVVAFLLSIIMPAAFAVTQKQLDDADAKTKQAQKELQKAQDARKAALAQYNAIDKQISDTEDEIGRIETQIEQTKEDITLKQEELKAAEEEFRKYEAVFMVRARAMYENSEIDYLEILFGADDFGDFLSKIEMISQLMDYDNGILDKLNETKEKIAAAKEELENILVRQEENASSLEARKSSLNETLAQKQAMLDEMTKDVEKYKALYEEAERAEQELIRQNRSALSYSANPVKYTGGRFVWPVPASSRITSQYGYRIHPVYKTKKFHSGIDIGAPYGVDILAAADGTVTLATTNGGYGKCIIINHGSGITTLYGHNSTLLVSVGNKVTKGQVIAKAGSTGVSTGPHLHFEVRVNGSTTDPMQYLR